MSRRCCWHMFVVGLFGVILLSACEGDTGPAGIVPDGSVSGKVTVWEDAVFNSRNSPSSIQSGGFTVTLIGDSTRTATTGLDGSYSIPNVPAGTYVAVTSRDSASAIGYGTMKTYNFFVGGGSSFHSPDIGRKAPPPTNVIASIDTLITAGNDTIPGILVQWSVAPVTIFNTYIYTMIFRAPGGSFASTISLSGSGTLASFVTGLPPGNYAVSVQSDQGLFYVEENTGNIIFPNESAEVVAPANVTVTRPTTLELTSEILTHEFPDRKVVLAKKIDK